jgi:hypothetical protein
MNLLACVTPGVSVVQAMLLVLEVDLGREGSVR